MKEKTEKRRITLTKREIRMLTLLLHHFTDYMAFDDRQDHGLARLQDYRKFDRESKIPYYTLAGKFRRWNEQS
jgi:hypothetical protein